MAKTIRSHPTSHILVLEPFFGTTFIFSGFGPKMDLRFLHFPTSLRVKRPRPKGKKMRMDHPFILVCLSKCNFLLVFTIISPFVCETHFLKLLSYFNSFVYLQFKYGRLQIIISSKQSSFFKIRTLSQRYIHIFMVRTWLDRRAHAALHVCAKQSLPEAWTPSSVCVFTKNRKCQIPRTVSHWRYTQSNQLVIKFD